MKTKPLALSNITITGAAKTISVPNGGLIAAGFKTGVVFYLSGVASGSGPFVAGTVTDNSIMVPLATWTDQSIPTSYITPVQSATVSIVPQTGFSVWAFARQLYYGNVVGGWNNVSGVTVASTNQQLASLTYIGNDGILSVGEKPAVFADYTGLLSQITMLRSEATTLCAVLPTQNTLLAYLTGLGPWPWTDRTVGHDTVIPDPSIWTSKWSEIYNEIAALTANISAALNVLGAGGLISANNLIPNWDSELGPRPLSAGFNVYDTQLTAPLGTSKGYNASRYCRKYAGVGGATGFGGYITSYQTEAPTKCKAGKTYAINYMVKEISNSGTSITGDVGFLIAFSDGSGSSVGSAIILWGWNPALAFGTWWETGVASGLPTLLFTAPTGAASFSVQVICGNGFSGAGVELWLDNVSLIELPTLAAAATVGGTVDSVVTAIASKVVAPNTLVQRDSSGVVYSNCWNYASQLRASTQLVGAFNINDSSLLSGWDQPGMYRFGNAGTDNPGVSYGNMLTLCAGSDSMSQIVCDYLKPRMFIRSANWTGTWTFNGGGANGWTEVWTNNNNGGTITAANGYRKFADGQIMIWGVAAAGTSITWSGTLTFPNACLNVFLTPASAPSAIPYASTLTTTGCTVNNVGAILRYLAIGY